MSAPVRPSSNQPCWCGSGEKYKKCHRAADEQRAAEARVLPGEVSPRRTVPPQIPRPDYAESGIPGAGVPVASDRLDRLRRACRAAAGVLRDLGKAVRPGITTDALDALCHDWTIARGAYPSPLNFHGYPKSLCTSVNEVICHGIPDSRPLREGDIVNCDVTVYLDGMHGDCNATFPVGEIDEASRRLIEVTRGTLEAGIAAVRPGRPISDIGRATQQYAEKHGCTIFRAYCGHGIGERFHAPPQVPHYFDRGAATLMEPGMIFTIEPMVNLGKDQHVLWPDGWTVVAADGQRSAQFEETILVTDAGAEILTTA